LAEILPDRINLRLRELRSLQDSITITELTIALNFYTDGDLFAHIAAAGLLEVFYEGRRIAATPVQPFHQHGILPEARACTSPFETPKVVSFTNTYSAATQCW
jgi:hypothetical protein